jgi:hypothetical protein
MNAGHFEEELLQELKDYVTGRSGQAVVHRADRRAALRSRPHWRLASGGVGIAAAAITVAAVLANGSPPLQSSAPQSSAPQSSAPQSSSAHETGPLFHVQDAGFAIDAEPTGAVDITILDGSGEPDVNALRSDLAKAGVIARVMADVPTCRQLASSPGAPSPVGSAQAQAVSDPLDHPFYQDGDLVYAVDASAATRGTTLWIMFSTTLSTLFVERTADQGPHLNCLPDATGNQ